MPYYVLGLYFRNDRSDWWVESGTYVKLREKPDLADTVQLLIKQRGVEYVRGVKAAKELAMRDENTAKVVRL